MRTRDPTGVGADPESLDPELDEDPGEDPDLDLDEEIEPEPELAPEPEGEPEPEPEPRRTRGPRGRANGEEIRELRTQLDSTNRQLEELRRAPPQRVDPAAQQAAEERFFENLEQMPPREAYRTLWREAQRVMGQQFATHSQTTQESLDQQRYEANARTDPLYRRYRDKVEALVGAERARGNIVSREIALNQVYATDMRDRAARVVPGQRRAAAARVASQTTRAGGARGDVARGGGRRDQGSDDEALLRQTTVGDI